MNRAIVLLLVLALGCEATTAASTRDVQARSANVMAVAVDGVSGDLLARYSDEGDAAIEAATTADEARAALAAIKARWEPIWLALETFRIAHAAWAEAIEAGKVPPDISQVLDAYCVLVKIPATNLPKAFCDDSD